jgi:hypothetical protein
MGHAALPAFEPWARSLRGSYGWIVNEALWAARRRLAVHAALDTSLEIKELPPVMQLRTYCGE